MDGSPRFVLPDNAELPLSSINKFSLIGESLTLSLCLVTPSRFSYQLYNVFHRVVDIL